MSKTNITDNAIGKNEKPSKTKDSIQNTTQITKTIIIEQHEPQNNRDDIIMLRDIIIKVSNSQSGKTL